MVETSLIIFFITDSFTIEFNCPHSLVIFHVQMLNLFLPSIPNAAYYFPLNSDWYWPFITQTGHYWTIHCILITYWPLYHCTTDHTITWPWVIDMLAAHRVSGSKEGVVLTSVRLFVQGASSNILLIFKYRSFVELKYFLVCSVPVIYDLTLELTLASLYG